MARMTTDFQRQLSAADYRLPQRRARSATDVATVLEGVENVQQAGVGQSESRGILIFSGSPRQHLCCRGPRQKLLPQLQAALPSAVPGRHLTDRTTTIALSVSDVQFE